jgi:hypothetical protein
MRTHRRVTGGVSVGIVVTFIIIITHAIGSTSRGSVGRIRGGAIHLAGGVRVAGAAVRRGLHPCHCAASQALTHSFDFTAVLLERDADALVDEPALTQLLCSLIPYKSSKEIKNRKVREYKINAF